MMEGRQAGKAAYRHQAQARGFQTSVVLRIPVQQGGVTVVDVKLQVAGSSETVEVTAAAPLVQTTSTQVSSRVEPGHTEHAGAQLFPHDACLSSLVGRDYGHGPGRDVIGHGEVEVGMTVLVAASPGNICGGVV
jgi:hypothetical protein